MKEEKFFKKTVEDNIVDKDKILRSAVLKYKHNERPIYKRVAFKVATTMLMAAIFVIVIIFGNHIVGSNDNNKLSVVAYAAEGDASRGQLKIDENNCMYFDDKDAKFQIGKMYIEEHEYTLNNGETGVRNKFLYESKGALSVKGENIEKVQYTTEHGNLFYENTRRYEEFINSPDYMNIEVIVPLEEVTRIRGYVDSKSVEDVFIERWNSGALSEFSSKYFVGEDINDVINGEEYFFDWNIYNKDFIKISLSDSLPSDEIYMSGNSIEVLVNDNIAYNSLGAMREITSDSEINYTNLPTDTIEIKVYYKDGNIEIKVIETYYDNEGNHYAKLIS
ncbi:MAG: hypothetical protein RR620_00590 [Clostridium sp.]